MLSNELELTLRRALSIATKYRHEYATYEHLLLSITEDSDAKRIFSEYRIDLNSLRVQLQTYLKHDLQNLVDHEAKEAKPTAGFQRIIQRAALHSQANGQKIISSIHVLVEFFLNMKLMLFYVSKSII